MNRSEIKRMELGMSEIARLPIGRAFLSFTLVALFTCMLVPTTLDAQTPPVELISLPDNVDRVLRDYEDAWAGRDAESLANLFTEDGFVLRPGRPLVKGRDAIREAYRTSGGSLVLRPYGYALADSVGYIVGGFAAREDAPDVGKFVLTLRRTASGRWLIAADMDNGNSR